VLKQQVSLWMAYAAAMMFTVSLPAAAQRMALAAQRDLSETAARPAAFAGWAATYPLFPAALAGADREAAADGEALPEEPGARLGTQLGAQPESGSGLPESLQQESPDGSQDGSQNNRKTLMSADPATIVRPGSRPVVSLYSKYIPAGAAAPQIHGREKLILGARDLYSVGNFLDFVLAGGWSHLTNGQPNYGTNGGAFAQRVGAAAVRETSEGILTDGVFAVMLHEDPRYFVLGPQYSLKRRTLYAITRPLVTRNSSDGHRTINGSLLLGLAAGSALTNLYYPQSNRNFHDTMSTFGGAVGGSALGFFVDEFMDQALQAVHLQRKP
jgi:hypothetical protein